MMLLKLKTIDSGVFYSDQVCVHCDLGLRVIRHHGSCAQHFVMLWTSFALS